MDVLTAVGNPRFFTRTGPHSLATVAITAGCTAPACNVTLSGLGSLELAGPDEVSFIGNRRYVPALTRTRAGAVLVNAEMQSSVPSGTVALITPDPAAAWARVVALFHPMPNVRPGIHSSAVVASDAVVDLTAEICEHAVIGARAEIGPGCKIGPAAVIGEGVVLGPDCRIGAHVSISHAFLGARVYVYPGARIGQEGFGFTITPTGFQTIPQLGAVILEDDVEVGANATIDRGSLSNTVIGTGTRLDNLVQIARNVRIGRNCAVAALTGISGSVEIDDFVVVGGQAGFADHVRVGTRAHIGAQSGVMSDIGAGAAVVGSPARPTREVFREIAWVKTHSRKDRPNP